VSTEKETKIIGLTGIEFGDLVRITLKWALGACAVFLLACLVTGAFPLFAR